MRPAPSAIVRHLIAMLVSAVVLTLAAAVPADASESPSSGGLEPGATGSRQAALQAALGWAVTALHSPGALAGIVEDGRSTALSAGVADVATGQPTDPDMHFRIGSITKTFVATVMLQLVGDKRLQLTDTVDKWLPGVVDKNGNNGSQITVEMLLNMTSGLFNYTDDKCFLRDSQANPLRTFTPLDLIGYALKHTPKSPGTSYVYSNTNYILLGMIIKKVTGRGYAAEITDRILRPLGLFEHLRAGRVT